MSEPIGLPRTGIRKSCQFCRSRKIRCSGGHICNACRARSIECMYGREGAKGRPKGDRSNSKHKKAASSSAGEPTLADGAWQASSTTTPSPSPQCPTGDSTPATLETELIFLFQRLFIGRTGSQSTSYCSTLSSEPTDQDGLYPGHIVERSAIVGTGGDPLAELQQPVSYEELFFGINIGLVELIATLFGSLGCSPQMDMHARFFARRTDSDQTSQMFDAPTSSTSTDPIPADDNQVRQLIELWFAHHPLSILVSKTLLLHQLRNGTLNRCLLAAILADASLLLGEDSSYEGDSLFAWAIGSLRAKPSEDVPLASIQALIIIGWHELCFGSARRASCFLQIARLSTDEAQQRLRMPQSKQPCEFINGVSVADAETELIQRIYHFTVAVELWMTLQLKIPLCDSLQQADSLGFPPLLAAESPVVALDKASGNVATLQAQKRLLRQLWPMSHIATTLAPIYRLYPHASNDPTPASNEWETLTVLRLRKLLERGRDVSSTCRDVYGVLSEGITNLEARKSSHVSHIFAIASYRIILIHLLFPRPSDEQETMEISVVTLDLVLQNVSQYRNLLYFAASDPPPEPGILDAPRRCSEHIFAIGLDTCARALDRLLGFRETASEAYKSALDSRQGDIVALAMEFSRICEHPKLQIAPGLSVVKQNFANVSSKAVALDLDSVPTIGSSVGSSAPSDVAWPVSGDNLQIMDGLEDDIFLKSIAFDMNMDWEAMQYPMLRPS